MLPYVLLLSAAYTCASASGASPSLISFSLAECRARAEKQAGGGAASRGGAIAVLSETPYSFASLSLLWSEVEVTFLAANGTRAWVGAVQSRTGLALVGEASAESACVADAEAARGREGWAPWVSPAAWRDAAVAAMFDPLGLVRFAAAAVNANADAAAAALDPRGKSKPDAKLNPFTGGCARVPAAAAGAVSAARCSVNDVSLRFPEALVAGLLLSSFADTIVASPAFTYGFLGLSGIAALGLVVAVWIAFMPMRDRAKWFAVISAVNVGLFATGGAASGGLASALGALFPDSAAVAFVARNPITVTAVSVALIFSLTLFCCVSRGVADAAPTRIFMGLAVRAASVALFLFASQSAPLNVAVAFFFVGAQPLLLAGWWLVGAATLPFSVVEVVVNAVLGLACGGRCRLVTALRELLLLETPAEAPQPQHARADGFAEYASPGMPHATSGAVRQRAVSTRR